MVQNSRLDLASTQCSWEQPDSPTGEEQPDSTVVKSSLTAVVKSSLTAQWWRAAYQHSDEEQPITLVKSSLTAQWWGAAWQHSGEEQPGHDGAVQPGHDGAEQHDSDQLGQECSASRDNLSEQHIVKSSFRNKFLLRCKTRTWWCRTSLFEKTGHN